MQSFSDAATVIDLTLDIPVYLLDHMPSPDTQVIQGLLQFIEHRMSLTEDEDPYWDLRMANALTVICHARHPDALEMVVEIYNWLQDASPFMQHKLLRLMETLIHAPTYAPQARRWLKSMKPDQALYLPLLMIAARAHDNDQTTREHIQRCWISEPLMGARLMGLSGDAAFLETLTSELKKLAPFLRYLPLTEPHPPLFQHELWSEVAEAWFAIAFTQQLTPPWLDPALVVRTQDPMGHHGRHREWQEQLDAHLLERFGGNLPMSDEEWLKTLTEKDEEAKAEFLAARQIYLDATRPAGRRRLRLVTGSAPLM